MKYFKTLIIILLFWTTNLCDSNLLDLYKSKEIINDRKIVSIKSVMQEDEFGNEDVTGRYNDINYTSLKCISSDIFVDLLQTFFEIFVHGINSYEETNDSDTNENTKNWVITAIYHFNRIKSPIVKMIDSLFSFTEDEEVLKTSDQSFLKSLLSINLFLNYSIKKNPFIAFSRIEVNDQSEIVYILNEDNNIRDTINAVKILNTSIVQMIGLIERYRCKRCVIQDPYANNYVVNEQLNKNSILNVENIISLLKPSLDNLNALVNEGSDDYTDFDNSIYDPENILLENVLKYNNSFLGNVHINWNGKISKMKSIYNRVKDFHSIAHVLEYQEILIKTIADVFYIQIYNLLNSNSPGAISDLSKLYDNFYEYMDYMLPSNCSINVCNQILKARVLLKKILHTYNTSKDLNIITTLKEQFELEINIQLVTEQYRQNIAGGSPFPLLDFELEAPYETFKNIFSLLSYESYTNKDFYVTKVSDHVNLTSSQYYDPFLGNMIELKYVLFAFWTLLKVNNNLQLSNSIIRYSNIDLHDLSLIGFMTPDNDTGKRKKKLQGFRSGLNNENGQIFDEMLRIILKMYINLGDKPEAQNILLPLSIHLQHTDYHTCQKSMPELVMTLQLLYLTITIVENYLINNYSYTLYSLFVYSKYIMNDGQGPDLNKLRNDIKTYAENSTIIDVYNKLESLNLLYDNNSYNRIFPEDDKQILFFWNGRKKFGHDIFQNAIMEVTEFNDVIRLQWFGVKWFVSNILIKILNVLTSLKGGNASEDIFNIIQIKLNEILILELPNTIKIVLNDVVNAILTTLNSSWQNIYYTIIDESLTILYANLTEYACTDIPEIEYVINALDFEIEKFKSFSNSSFMGTQNTLLSTDFSLSPAADETVYLYYIIEILYNCADE